MFFGIIIAWDGRFKLEKFFVFGLVLGFLIDFKFVWGHKRIY
jgi:hypothetical protein